MKLFIIVGLVILFFIIILSFCKVAGDSDRRIEELYRERRKNIGDEKEDKYDFL